MIPPGVCEIFPNNIEDWDAASQHEASSKGFRPVTMGEIFYEFSIYWPQFYIGVLWIAFFIIFSSRTLVAKALKVLIMKVRDAYLFFFANFLHIPNSYLSDDPNQSSQVIFQKKSQFSNLLFRFLISMIIWILKKRCLNLISDNVNN